MTYFEREDNALSACPEWWESEYQKCKADDSYEWFTGLYDEKFVTTLLSLILSPSSRIVNLGCGISRIQESLSDAGFHDITNVRNLHRAHAAIRHPRDEVDGCQPHPDLPLRVRVLQLRA
jgi:hypothetical protein